MTIRCDTCDRTVEPAEGGWTYFTPSKASEKQALHGEGFWAEDERWFVCVECEPLVELNSLIRLCQRWLRLNPEKAIAPAKRPDYRGQWIPCSGLEYAALALKGFMDNKTDKRVWEDVVSPAGPPQEGAP